MPPPHHRARAHGGGWSHGGPGALDFCGRLFSPWQEGAFPTCTGANGLLRSLALSGYHDLRRAGGGGDGPLSAHHRALPQTLRPYPFPRPAASPPRKSSQQVIIMVTHSITFHQASSSAPSRGRHTGVFGGRAWAFSSSARAGRPPGWGSVGTRQWTLPPRPASAAACLGVDARGPHCGRLSWLLAGLPAGGRYTRQGQACEVGATQRS